MKNFKNFELTPEQQENINGRSAKPEFAGEGKPFFGKKGGRKAHDKKFFADKGNEENNGKQPWIVAGITKLQWKENKKAERETKEVAS